MAFPGAPFASTREHPRDPFLIRQMRLPLKRRMWQGARATKCGRGRYDDDQEYAVLGALKILARTWANHALAKTNRDAGSTRDVICAIRVARLTLGTVTATTRPLRSTMPKTGALSTPRPMMPRRNPPM